MPTNDTPQGDDVSELRRRLESQAEELATQRRRIAELETRTARRKRRDPIPCKLKHAANEARAKAWAAMGILIRYGAIPMPVIDVDSKIASDVLFNLSAVLGIVELSIEAADLIDYSPTPLDSEGDE